MGNPIYELLGVFLRGGRPAVAEVVKDGVRQAAGEIVEAFGATIARPKAPGDPSPKEPVDERPKR